METRVNRVFDSEHITLTVNSVNDVPVLAGIGDQSTNEDTDLTIGVSSSEPDLEFYGEQHTFTLSCDDGRVTTSCASTGDRTADCTFSPDANEYFDTSCTVVVDDGNGGSDSETFGFTVDSVNDVPVLSNIGDHSTDEDTDLTISVSSSDADLANYGEAHTFTLTCDDASLVSTSCVSTGDYGNTADCTFDVLDHQYGSAGCTVTVVDGNGSSDSEDITLTVNSVNDAQSVFSTKTTVDGRGLPPISCEPSSLVISAKYFWSGKLRILSARY